MENQEPLKITYNKNEKVADAEEKISDILSEAVYSYLMRRKLPGNPVDKDRQI
jgi:hypothetical protein